MQIPLRKRYITGVSYKSMKSTSANSGGSKKGKVKGKPREQNITGLKVKLLNLSTTPQYCAQSGVLLPYRGMVVRHNGQLYRDYRAASLAALAA